MSDLPPLHSNTRRVAMTATGFPIGWTEKLSDDNPFRRRFAKAAPSAAQQMYFKNARKKGNVRATTTRGNARGK